MAPELRKRAKSQTVVEKPAVKKTKATPKRQATEDASPVSIKKQKTVKEVKTKTPAEEPKPRAAKGSKKKAAKPEPESEPEPEKMDVEDEVAAEEAEVDEAETSAIPVADVSDSEDGDDDEIDADIQALAAGLDPEDDDGSTPGAAGFKAGQDVGKIPQKLSKKEKKALAAARNAVKEEPGVIYVGRLPHGFYEAELKGYFGQFGTVSRLRLSRNKKTGKSKHFAFIEFAEESTAHIAAKTMDKYLLFGHILTVKFVSNEQLNSNVWKGANKRFKQIPWNKIAGKKLARPLTEAAWEERNSKETKRRAERAEKLKAIGYEFEAPALKQAPPPAAIEAVEEGEKKAEAVEEAPAATEEAPAVEEAKEDTEVVDAPEPEAETPKAAKKGKAGKKAKKAKA